MDEERVQWEYGTLQGSDFRYGEGYNQAKNNKNASIEELGRQGWEGYAALQGGSGSVVYLKRKMHPTHKSNEYDYGR